MATKSLRDSAVRQSFRASLVRVARGEIGEGEHPPRSNRTKYGKWYGMNGAQWCAMFVSWVYNSAAAAVGCENPLVGLQSRKGFAHVNSTYSQAKRWGIVLAKGEDPMPGDVIIWSKSKSRLLSMLNRSPGHTGMVTTVNADGSFYVVEGNTDPSYSRTGGNVMEHRHSLNDGRHGYLRAIYRPSRRFHNPNT